MQIEDVDVTICSYYYRCVIVVDKDCLQTSHPRVQIEDADVDTLELMVDHLTQQIVEKTKDHLVVDVSKNTRAVWMRKSTEWVKECDVPDECPIEGVCVCHVSDGLVVVGGKIAEDKPSSQCHHFSLFTGQWKKLANMATPRRRAAAVEVEEMMMLVVGGFDRWNDGSDDCERLDIRCGVWTPTASHPTRCGSFVSAAAAGRIYILEEGAYYGAPDFSYVEYDPASDTHTEKASLPEYVGDTSGARLVGVRDKIYLFGGQKTVLTV